MTIGPRRSTPLGGRTNRGFGAGFTLSGLTTCGLASFAAFTALSFFGFATFSFFVGIAGAWTTFVGVGIAAANFGRGGGASRTGASGAGGATGVVVYVGGVYEGGVAWVCSCADG